MDWYYAESGRQVGPIQEDSFDALVRSGVVRPDTLVWQQGMPNWQTYGMVRPVAAPVAPPLDAAASVTPGPSTRFCSECGRPFPQSELIPFGSSFVCATCKETFAHKLREGVNVAGALRYAGFWIRFVAILIDGAILVTVSLLLNAVAGLVLFTGGVARGGAMAGLSGAYFAIQGVIFFVNLGIGIWYQVYFLTHYSATPGKLALRLKVIPAKGGPISMPLAIARFFANYLSMFTLGIGYMMAGFDPQKRALHDRICETRVIHA
ncbi:MAG TPA: RDD family protein [Bryobacteraceae bacterium]|nr:RDD family protein [Bryobacteraceae bacterium]